MGITEYFQSLGAQLLVYAASLSIFWPENTVFWIFKKNYLKFLIFEKARKFM